MEQDKKYEPINYHGKTFYPPFHLFQNEEGLWGLKDSKDAVYYRPIYKRSEKEGSSNVFVHIDQSEVVEFDEEEGFALRAYCSEPFRETAWSVANYPEEFHDMIWKRLKDRTDTTESDIKILKRLQKTLTLSSQEKLILEMLMLRLQLWQDDLSFDEEDEIEKQLMERHYQISSAQNRVDILVDLMKKNNLSLQEQEMLIYMMFEMNDTLWGY